MERLVIVVQQVCASQTFDRDSGAACCLEHLFDNACGCWGIFGGHCSHANNDFRHEILLNCGHIAVVFATSAVGICRARPAWRGTSLQRWEHLVGPRWPFRPAHHLRLARCLQIRTKRTRFCLTNLRLWISFSSERVTDSMFNFYDFGDRR